MPRFQQADAYRAQREWQRYVGTPQRDLFRELRERFLARHSASDGWVLDFGSGPGRFLPFIGGPAARRVALDVSHEMLELAASAWVADGRTGRLPDRVVGIAERPPLRTARWSEVVVLGNTLGFAGPNADRLLNQAVGLVAPGGSLLVEAAPAPGERSIYLERLPPSAVARLLRSPVRAVISRVVREGFKADAPRHRTPRSFRRFSASELREHLSTAEWEVTETMAVAPALGADARRVEAVRGDPKAWSHLLELEEEVGRRPDRWAGAAAVLVAARHAPLMRMIK